MALAVRLLPSLVLRRLLPGEAARSWGPRTVDRRQPVGPGHCCFCLRRLNSGAILFPYGACDSAAAARLAQDPRRRLLLPAGLPGAFPAAPACARRGYSTEEQQPPPRQKTKMIILGFSNPINWVRTRIYAFLIWAYFDPEFSIAQFSEGAKQVG